MLRVMFSYVSPVSVCLDYQESYERIFIIFLESGRGPSNNRLGFGVIHHEDTGGSGYGRTGRKTPHGPNIGVFFNLNTKPLALSCMKIDERGKVLPRALPMDPAGCSAQDSRYRLALHALAMVPPLANPGSVPARVGANIPQTTKVSLH